MPRPPYKRPYQPKNKPQGGGVPPEEGRPVDVRMQMGEYMQACVATLSDADNISISAYCRNVMRDHLASLGVTFR